MSPYLKYIAVLLIMIVSFSCSKNDSSYTPPGSTTYPKTPTRLDSLRGKWVFVKDTVLAFDGQTQIQYPEQIHFDGDYMQFNSDSTGILSDQFGWQVLNKNFIALYDSNFVQPPAIPVLNFTFKIAADDSSISMSNSDYGFVIRNLTATSFSIFTQVNAPVYPHDYIFKQTIYFKKQ